MMKNLTILLFSIYILLLVGCQNNQTTEIQKDNNSEITRANLHLLMATAWYQQSAEMDACYYQAFYQAKLALEENIANDSSPMPNAIVLDIDETVLDNSPFQVNMIKTGESYSKEYWKRWTDMSDAKALPGAIDFLEIAKNLDVEIYYISNRRTNELESTITNMKNLGFPEIRKDHFLFKEETSNKEARRDTIKKDYDVLLYLGDNLNDYSNFLGNRKENFGKDILAENKDILGRDFIILPNPMYGNWAQALSSSIEEENPNKLLLILLENMTDFKAN